MNFFSRLQKNFTRKYFLLSLFCIIFAGSFFFATGVFAQATTNFGLGKIGSLLPLGGEDIWVIAAKIIRIFLSLLGIIALGLILYAGFLWMTSAGNEEKIASAKKTLINASIGIAIILSSLAITQFILSSLVAATGGTMGDDLGPGGRGGGACANFAECQANNGIHECGDEDFVVKSLTPKTPQDNGTGMTNIVVRAVFSQPLDAGQDLSKVFSVSSSNGIILPKETRIQAGRQIVEAFYNKTTALCQDETKGCLSEGTYKITVNPDLIAGGLTLKTRLNCGEFDNTANFVVNKDFLDQLAPELPSFTFDGKNADQRPILPRGKSYLLNATFQDRRKLDGGTFFGGMSYLRLKVEGDVLDPAKQDILWNYFTGPRAGSNESFAFSQNVNFGASSSIPALYTFTLTGGDIDSNSVIATSSFILDGELCHNGRQDPGETAIDIGGDCLGNGRCSAGWQCISGVCENGMCVNSPVIYNVDVGGLNPDAWKSSAGSWVTIVGHFFGEDAGRVEFGRDTNNDGTADDWRRAPLANCNGLDMWKNNTIVVEVPDIPVDTSTTIRVVTLAHGQTPEYTDLSNDNKGPKPGPNSGIFVINNEVHPGLCAVVNADNLSVGTSTQDITAYGRDLGVGANSALLFGGLTAKIRGWGDLAIRSNVPQNFQAGTVGVKAKVGDTFTNGVQFSVISLSDTTAPIISSVTPGSTTAGSLITLVGTTFGESGTVYLSNNRQTALACALAGAPGAECKVLNLVDLPELCGDTWSDTQIIGKIPEDITAGDNYIVVRNNVGNFSDGTALITIKNGDPRPGLCRLLPDNGIAPLAEDADPLQLIGTNLNPDPVLYYWALGASSTNVLTNWLNSEDNTDPYDDEPIRSVSADGTEIMTTIPFSETGTSMITGPIRAKVGGFETNDIRYTVDDCTKSPSSTPGDDYQCCTEGDEAGSWKPSGYACLGQTRDAGYVWRFTTGFIPKVPYVLEACSLEDWRDLQKPNFERPSPSPSADWKVGNACINSLITAQFSLPMGTDNVAQNVRVYTCGQGESPDCRYNEANNVSAHYSPVFLNGNRSVLELRFNAPNFPVHTTSTWHRVLLGADLHAQVEEGFNFNEVQVNTQKFAAQRPLKDSISGFPPVSYYFDFKTGEQLCTLIGAGIVPPDYTARLLGMLQEPGRPISENLDNPPFPYYYYVWGRGNQQCSVIDVNGQGWEWRPQQQGAQFGYASKSDNMVGIPVTSSAYASDIRATVTALQNTDVTPVPITASITRLVEGVERRITGTSTLNVDLGDPKIIRKWPDCNQSCVNVNIGVDFSRHMATSTYRVNRVSGIRIQECRDLGENCNVLDPAELGSLPTVDINAESFSPMRYEVSIPGQLKLNQLYKVTVTDQIKSIGRYSADGFVLGPSLVQPTSWKFRTKLQDGICKIEQVDVLPDPFYSTLVGQKTVYNASALSSPDQCNSQGQRLNPWLYGWNWSVANPLVATTTHFASKGNPKAFCTQGCKPAGSDFLRGATNYLCGNAVVDPGEDCDIAAPANQEIVGVTCTLSCLRPGNKNSTNTTTPAEELIGKCGNGVVENPSNLIAGRRTFGEECDPGIPEMRDFCTSDCLWKGTDSNFSDAVGALQCGNGSIGLLNNNGGTLGEECDLGITLQKASANNHVNWAGVGCSDKCLHTGTQLSRSYCEGLPSAQSEIKNSVECQNSVSVCGNGAIEPGEECEVADFANNVIYIPSLEGGVDITRMLAVVSSSAVCSDSCLLKTACDEEDSADDDNILPNRDPSFNGNGFRISSHYKCAAGTPGCSDTCTFLGSSPLYETASLCGDGIDGIGENSLCENDSAVAPIGENPLQIVEALGQGVVDPETNSQRTVIKAEATKIRKTATESEAIPGNVSGTAQYNLQCGYVEYAEAKIEDEILRLNNCDDPTYGVASNSCCVPRPHVTQSYPVHGAGIVRDPDTNDVGAVCLNTYIEATFDTLLDEEAIAGKVTLAHTLPAGVAACQDGEVNVTALTQSFLALNENNANDLPLFAKVWQHIKEFFIAMFQSVVHAVGPVDEDIDNQIINAMEDELGVNPIWCAGRVVPTLSHFEKREGEGEEGDSYSAVTIKINQLLATNTFYAVILSGGNAGFRNLQGVGIQGKAYLDDATKFNKDDMFIFKTGEELCRIKEVDVEPNNYLYTTPSESADYHADAISTNGQRIVGTPGYMWTWSWQPQSTALYTFAAPTTTENITISSTNLEGKLLVSAQATVTEDVSANQLHNIFSGMLELTSMFCQNPWPSREAYPYEDKSGNNDGFDWAAKTFDGSPILPAVVHNNPEYFNFSFGYCADSGNASDFQDDLPLLRPKVEGHLRGFHTERQCRQAGNRSGEQICNEVRVFDQVIDSGNLPADIFKKFLFFNNKNDDLVGIQIFENSDRKPIREWYASKNLGALEMYNDIEIDGYQGITDGNNYYINALNELSNKSVKNYVYLFSININAQENTREVFQKLITSLLFNINISQRESCLQGQSVDAQSRVLPQNLANAAIADIACQDDFACRRASGAPIEGTLGICANAKTKFQNDWKRLNAIQTIQKQIENSRTAKGIYPQLLAGTYIPGYTNRHWPSWNTLTEEIGDTPVVPLDTWSACGVCQNQDAGKNVGCNVNTDCAGLGDICNLPDDMRSCWRSANTSFACPAVSSVLEYKTTGPNDYHLYLPLEYFNNAAIPVQRAIISEFVSTTHYSDVSSCGVAGLELKSPEAGACGDGIVNAATEDCDPVGTMSSYSCVGSGCLVTCAPGQTAYYTCNNTCHYDAPVCRQNLSCGNGRVDAGETCDDGVANGSYNHCSLNCDYFINSFCGNGTRDWLNRSDPPGAQAPQHDEGEAYLEFCEKTDSKYIGYGYCSKDRVVICNRVGNPLTWFSSPPGLNSIDHQCDPETEGVCLSMDDPTYNINGYVKNPVLPIFAIFGFVDVPTVGEAYPSCSTDCQGPGGFCGDGKLQVPDEECDDSNRTSFDGCSNYCQKENLACANIVRNLPGNIQTQVGPPETTSFRLNYLSDSPLPDECMSTTGREICLGLGMNCKELKYLNRESNSYENLGWPFTLECGTNLSKTLNKSLEITCFRHPIQAVLAATPEEESLCGNNIHDPGEECDMGRSPISGNGIACTPTYGTACTYCAADCSRVFTVDPTRACGNGKIDVMNEDPTHAIVEACDINQNGQVVRQLNGVILPDNPSATMEALQSVYNGTTVPISCSVTEGISDPRVATGTLACTNDCRVLDRSNCVECGQYTDINTSKAIPKLAVLNVLSPSIVNPNWGSVVGDYHQSANSVSPGFLFNRTLFLNSRLEHSWDSSDICASSGWLHSIEYWYKQQLENGTSCLDPNRVDNRDCRELHRKYSNIVDERNYMAFQWMCNSGAHSPRDRGYGYQKITNLDQDVEASWNWGNYTEDLSMIESSPMCNGDSGYSIYFGKNGIHEERSGGSGYVVESRNAYSFYSQYGDFFPYPVNGEGREIKNEYVVSPAVPPDTFRVVVKWKTNDANVKFTGLVYNSEFNNNGVADTSQERFGATVSYMTAASHWNICQVMEKFEAGVGRLNPNDGYWLPTLCHKEFAANDGSGGVYFHKVGNLEKIGAQALTIPTKNNDLFDIGTTYYTAPYAFFVQAITANNNSTNISALEDLDVTVDVYEFHEGQVPEYSMYLPTATYTMRMASKSSNTGTDALVKYWHVFNLQKVGNEYQIKKPIDADTQRTYDNGLLVTDFADVLCRVPENPPFCNRDE